MGVLVPTRPPIPGAPAREASISGPLPAGRPPRGPPRGRPGASGSPGAWSENPTAPRLRASTAASMVPWAVIMITGREGAVPLSWGNRSSPDPSGRDTSQTTTAGRARSRSAPASSTEAAAQTSKPHWPSRMRRTSRMAGSSSTTITKRRPSAFLAPMIGSPGEPRHGLAGDGARGAQRVALTREIFPAQGVSSSAAFGGDVVNALIIKEVFVVPKWHAHCVLGVSHAPGWRSDGREEARKEQGHETVY